MQENADKLISVGEAARILGVAIQTLRRWDMEGKLIAHRSIGGQRRYLKSEIGKLLLPDMLGVARNWAMDTPPTELDESLYCQTRAVFETRLQRFSASLENDGIELNKRALIVSVVGEIGNNSFDHNLGNWFDVPGILFGYDSHSGNVVLADRGQGILATLKRVMPSLSSHAGSLTVAFNETITGRAPEKRGNGLKFVKKVIQNGNVSIVFQTGNAKLSMNAGDSNYKIETIKESVIGTLVLIKFDVVKK